MKRSLAVLAAIAAAALVTVSLAAGKSQATVKFSAALTVSQETDHPKGTKPGASGSFSGDAHRQQAEVDADLEEPDRACHSGPHPHRQTRHQRQRPRPALPSRLHLPKPRHLDAKQSQHQADRERRNLRQRSHRKEQPRRNPRTTHANEIASPRALRGCRTLESDSPPGVTTCLASALLPGLRLGSGSRPSGR